MKFVDQIIQSQQIEDRILDIHLSCVSEVVGNKDKFCNWIIITKHESHPHTKANKVWLKKVYQNKSLVSFYFKRAIFKLLAGINHMEMHVQKTQVQFVEFYIMINLPVLKQNNPL